MPDRVQQAGRQIRRTHERLNEARHHTTRMDGLLGFGGGSDFGGSAVFQNGDGSALDCRAIITRGAWTTDSGWWPKVCARLLSHGLMEDAT